MYKLYFYGDSNTYGYDPRGFGAGDADLFAEEAFRYPAEHRWPDILARLLAGRWEICADGMNGRTLPAGDAALSLLARRLLAEAPVDVFGVMLGSNDLLNSFQAPDGAACARRLNEAAEQENMLRAFDASIRAESGNVPERKTVNGTLVPHAGWIYSGRLAASTLSRIEPPETVVVLAPKHRREGANLAVMPYGAWNYGAGKIDADLEFADAFVRALPEFKKDAAAHRSEHSIEVQLPLIARYFPGSKVVGVLIGGATKTELKGLAERFAAFLDEWVSAGHSKPLLLVSSDMNHYATDAATREIDKLATDAIETTEPDALFDTVMRNGITMCGVLPAFFALSTLKKRGEFNRAAKVGYATSGDASGDLERVVGYAGYLFD